MAGTLLPRSEEELREIAELDALWERISAEVEQLPAEEVTLNRVAEIVRRRISGDEALRLVARDLLEAAESHIAFVDI